MSMCLRRWAAPVQTAVFSLVLSTVLWSNPARAISNCGNRPGNPACGTWQCQDSGWELIPKPAGTTCNSSGYPGSCDGTNAQCVRTVSKGSMFPNFLVTHVVYAPPGRFSSMSYTAGNTYGSTISTSDSYKAGTSVTISNSGGFLFFAQGGITVKAGRDWGSTQTNVTDVSTSYTSTYRKPGQVNSVDHDDDEIWFLVGPKIDVTITPKTSTLPQLLDWQFAPTQPASAYTYYVYVGELRNPATMPQNVKDFLDSRGITPAYYGELLKADPWAAGAPPNPTLDPNRYVFLKSFPYQPPQSPGDLPTTITDTVLRSVSNNTTNDSFTTYSTGTTFSGDTSFFGLVSFSLKVDSQVSFTASTSRKTSDGSSTSEQIVIGQPDYGYAGPTLVRVYEDKIWKTYFFSLDVQ